MSGRGQKATPKRDADKPLSLVSSENAQPPTPRRFQVNSLRGIRREMGAVYKMARTGDLDLSEACRYAYLLTTLGKLSESELLEARLARLEERIGAARE